VFDVDVLATALLIAVILAVVHKKRLDGFWRDSHWKRVGGRMVDLVFIFYGEFKYKISLSPLKRKIYVKEYQDCAYQRL
jgi:hypothetical protein